MSCDEDMYWTCGCPQDFGGKTICQVSKFALVSRWCGRKVVHPVIQRYRSNTSPRGESNGCSNPKGSDYSKSIVKARGWQIKLLAWMANHIQCLLISTAISKTNVFLSYAIFMKPESLGWQIKFGAWPLTLSSAIFDAFPVHVLFIPPSFLFISFSCSIHFGSFHFQSFSNKTPSKWKDMKWSQRQGKGKQLQPMIQSRISNP